MRPTSTPSPPRSQPVARPASAVREADQKNTGQPKPPPKRSLNEAAHKLIR